MSDRQRRYFLLLRPDRGAEYCDKPVCLCVCLCVREHISGTAGPICTTFCVRIPCGRGSVLLWRRCGMLCISGFIFMDDVTFRGAVIHRNATYCVFSTVDHHRL